MGEDVTLLLSARLNLIEQFSHASHSNHFSVSVFYVLLYDDVSFYAEIELSRGTKLVWSSSINMRDSDPV